MVRARVFSITCVNTNCERWGKKKEEKGKRRKKRKKRRKWGVVGGMVDIYDNFGGCFPHHHHFT